MSTALDLEGSAARQARAETEVVLARARLAPVPLPAGHGPPGAVAVPAATPGYVRVQDPVRPGVSLGAYPPLILGLVVADPALRPPAKRAAHVEKSNLAVALRVSRDPKNVPAKCRGAAPGPVCFMGGTLVLPGGRVAYPHELGIEASAADLAALDEARDRSRRGAKIDMVVSKQLEPVEPAGLLFGGAI